MTKLVYHYKHCDASGCSQIIRTFEYESKEKFVSDVLKNPMILNNIGVQVSQFEVDIYKERLSIELDEEFEYFVNVNKYVFTLDEWFINNKKEKHG